MGDKQKSHFGLIWVRTTVEKRRRELRGGREGRRRKRRTRSRYVCLGIKCILMSRAFSMNFPWRLFLLV